MYTCKMLVNSEQNAVLIPHFFHEVTFISINFSCLRVVCYFLPRSPYTLRFPGAAGEPPQANTTLVMKALPQDVAILAFTPFPHCGVSPMPLFPQSLRVYGLLERGFYHLFLQNNNLLENSINFKQKNAPFR